VRKKTPCASRSQKRKFEIQLAVPLITCCITCITWPDYNYRHALGLSKVIVIN